MTVKSKRKEVVMPASNYGTDFYAWANEQAALLRAGRLSSADIENIAEEIESMGRTEKRELVSRLNVLLTHLLKWKFQPNGRCSSWRTSIKVQRNRIVDHLRDNPSLRPQLPDALEKAHRDAILEAAEETKLGESVLPPRFPWSLDVIIEAGFWPELIVFRVTRDVQHVAAGDAFSRRRELEIKE